MIRKSTIARLEREPYAHIGRYYYRIDSRPAGCAVIQRHEWAHMDELPRYGDYWETVARFDPNTGWTRL